MLSNSLLARVGLERLRLPVPGAKLAVIHRAAQAIQDPATSQTLWQAYLDWLKELELESEVAESLCIALLLKEWPLLSTGHLQAAIDKPSILSDVMLSQLLGRAPLVNSWATAHSGEAPTFFSGAEALAELAAARIVPPIMRNRLLKLEQDSGKPFQRQWAYEYERLVDRLGPQTDGHWTYFAEDLQTSVGQFVTRRGQIARSAYLRMLALAVSSWGMPERLGRSESLYATPVDFAFLQMPPTQVPSWGEPLQRTQPLSQGDCETLINEVVAHLGDEAVKRKLLHLHTALRDDQKYRGELEVITMLYNGPEPDIEAVFRAHEFLPGRVEIPRTHDSRFVLETMGRTSGLPSGNGGHLLPALLPCVTDSVGYLDADLLSRLPYLPANYSDDLPPIAIPRAGGLDIKRGDEAIGELSYWNLQWAPTHDRALGSGCGVAVTLSEESQESLFTGTGARILRVWRAKILTRENNYGEWTEAVYSGSLA